MISPEEARTRVARGAALLDRVRPNWFNEIDTGRLTLAGCSSCIVGQLYGDYSYVFQLFHSSPDGRHTHGFTANCEFGDERHVALNFQALQDAWIEAIADRLHAPPLATNAVDPVPQIVAEGLRA